MSSERSRGHELGEELIGTCSLTYPDEVLELTGTELQDFDDTVFECDGCGWWCSTDEEHTVGTEQLQLCDDCAEKEEA